VTTVPRVLITGMSGTGKSSVIERLAALGHTAIDTDSDAWCEWVEAPVAGGGLEPDWIWREDRISRLLDAHRTGALFVSGCRSNQGRFHDRFDHIVLLTAPIDIMLDRIGSRTTNPYGKSDAERALVIAHERSVLPLLRASADIEIDTSRASLDDVVTRLTTLVER
jgi:RNase adaptor protein for sRNA GlmZ degradation